MEFKRYFPLTKLQLGLVPLEQPRPNSGQMAPQLQETKRADERGGGADRLDSALARVLCINTLLEGAFGVRVPQSRLFGASGMVKKLSGPLSSVLASAFSRLQWVLRLLRGPAL